ncbi:MAG TPA: hypothetical protein VFQ42_22445 [Mycobacterium sp.]|nr:hypothetical protein [Mycobacterium sp.]
METTTRTEIRISANDVQYRGYTLDQIQAIVAPVECPADVTPDLDYSAGGGIGRPCIVISMLVELYDESCDAAVDELLDTLAAAGVPHSVSFGLPQEVR